MQPFTPDGLFAMMSCTASCDTLYWLFSYEREGWEGYRRSEVEGFKSSLLNNLKDSSGEWWSLLKEVVRKTDIVKFYPIFKLPLERKWSRGHCILLGDAAHRMQPHSGQGVSMALEDVFMLLRLLEAPSAPLPGVFDKLHQIRRPRVEKFYNDAASNRDRLRKSGVCAQWFKELRSGRCCGSLAFLTCINGASDRLIWCMISMKYKLATKAS
jgi:2-polyprenyl-6-methoxyphenol hydroxylase-like FAD-dependent oxidoreductase